MTSCAVCDAQMTAQRSTKKTCSQACRNKLYRDSKSAPTPTTVTEQKNAVTRQNAYCNESLTCDNTTVSISAPRTVRPDRDLEAEDRRRRAKRTRKLMAHIASGQPVKEFADYVAMSGREVGVAIGWFPWPAGWPS
jgi:hypothetical protein